MSEFTMCLMGNRDDLDRPLDISTTSQGVFKLNIYRLLSLLVTLLLIVTGCGVATKVVVPDPSNGGTDEDEFVYLFKNDFSESEIGGSPVGWNYSDTYGLVEVVAAPELPSGKAVRIKGNVEDGKNVSMNAVLWDPPASEANRIAVEHMVRWDHGTSINMYITRSNTHYLNWYIIESDGVGKIGYRRRDGSIVSEEFGELEPGWNRVRLIADPTENQVYIFLNDMETPVVGPYTFREKLDTWVDTRISFSHTTRTDGTSEVYYGDVKIWALD